MYYKQTKLFSEFKCVGGSCINNCCHGWIITWSEDGVYKLRSASGCSNKLRELAQNAFVKRDDGKYIIQLGDDGVCPFQLKGGLCIIQKELGEEFLSDDCSAFPRRYFSAGQSVYCSCGLSCPAVIQGLIDEENAAVILTSQVKPNIRGEVRAAVNSPEYIKAHSELKYHKELLEFFYELISDKRFSAEVNIVRGALAAEKLTEAVGQGGGRKIAGAVSELREALEDRSVIDVIEGVQPEYDARLRMLTVYTESLFGTGLADLFKNDLGQADAAKFEYSKKRLDALLDGKTFWLKNIALDLLFEFAVLFRYPQKSIYENYTEYAVVAAVLKMTFMAAVMRDKMSIKADDDRKFEFHGSDCIAGLCSVVARDIIQSKGAVEKLFHRLNSDGLTPRDIAMLMI